MARLCLIVGIIFQIFFLFASASLWREYGNRLLAFPFCGAALIVVGLSVWASSKKRNPCWGLFGLVPPLIIIGPVVGIIVVARLKRGDSEAFLNKKNAKTTLTHLPDVSSQNNQQNKDDKLLELKKLAELKDSGVLSEEEFKAEKIKILSR